MYFLHLNMYNLKEFQRLKCKKNNKKLTLYKMKTAQTYIWYVTYIKIQ